MKIFTHSGGVSKGPGIRPDEIPVLLPPVPPPEREVQDGQAMPKWLTKNMRGHLDDGVTVFVDFLIVYGLLWLVHREQPSETSLAFVMAILALWQIAEIKRKTKESNNGK